MNERQCLLSLLQLVKIELKRIDFSYHGDVPTRIAHHTKRMKEAEQYVEEQLAELNERENLYEYQDGHR